MAYILGDRSQLHLFPQGLEEAIGADDPVRVYDAFVDQLDLGALGIEEDAEQVGPPAYAPRAMLKLLVYGYAYGIRSSRQLERATYHNVSFMWVVGGLKPDHKTIARFRQTHRPALAQVLKQCAQLCLKLGLVEGNTLFVDGTKVRANASLSRTWTPEKCTRVLRRTAQRIEQLLVECERADQEEAGQGSLVQRHHDLQQAQTVHAQVQAIMHDLQTSGQSSVNQTDRDCRTMKSRHGPMAGYNLQAVVDDQHGPLSPETLGCWHSPHPHTPCGTAAPGSLGRAIVRHRAEVVKQQFEAQFQEPASQAIYRRRKTKVEHPFGHLKRNLGVTSFLLRGLAGVRAETSLLATAFNLRRLITLLGVTGVQEQLATG